MLCGNALFCVSSWFNGLPAASGMSRSVWPKRFWSIHHTVINESVWNIWVWHASWKWRWLKWCLLQGTISRLPDLQIINVWQKWNCVLLFIGVWPRWLMWASPASQIYLSQVSCIAYSAQSGAVGFSPCSVSTLKREMQWRLSLLLAINQHCIVL